MHPSFPARYVYQLLCAGYVNVPPCIICIACVTDISLYQSQILAININYCNLYALLAHGIPYWPCIACSTYACLILLSFVHCMPELITNYASLLSSQVCLSTPMCRICQCTSLITYIACVTDISLYQSQILGININYCNLYAWWPHGIPYWPCVACSTLACLILSSFVHSMPEFITSYASLLSSHVWLSTTLCRICQCPSLYYIYIACERVIFLYQYQILAVNHNYFHRVRLISTTNTLLDLYCM